MVFEQDAECDAGQWLVDHRCGLDRGEAEWLERLDPPQALYLRTGPSLSGSADRPFADRLEGCRVPDGASTDFVLFPMSLVWRCMGTEGGTAR